MRRGMKPLMMMRTRGLSGPFFTNHAKVNKLSKSAGTSVGLGISGASVTYKAQPVTYNGEEVTYNA